MLNNEDTIRITVAQMAPHVHSFKIGENKVLKIYNWLKDWIKINIENGKIKPHFFLPPKGDLAFHIGVSQGTIQNVYRLLEDAGYVESKQRIGTYIKDKSEHSTTDKLTSKKEVAIQKIKKLILDNYKIGDTLPTTRFLSKELNISFSTIRISINSLIQENIINKINNRFVVCSLDFSAKNIENKTLVEKIAESIKKIILSSPDNIYKIPATKELAKKYKVSLKTINDAIKILSLNGILKTRRGNYGTYIVREENKIKSYRYESAEIKIRKYISENCKSGDKLPTIRKLAEMFDVSIKTISSALYNLKEEGYITVERGRNGGIIVIDIPQKQGETYAWIAINPNYISTIEN